MQTNNIRDEKIETLNELIAVTRDSAEFYGDAATKADNPQWQSLFREMAASKGQLVGALSSEVGAEGATPDRDGTFRGSEMPEGTYTFIAHITDRAGRTFKRSGSVLLLRK